MKESRKRQCDPRRVKAHLALAGLTQTDIARRAGVSRSHVSMVVGGLAKSRRVREAIAQACGLEYDQLWSS